MTRRGAVAEALRGEVARFEALPERGVDLGERRGAVEIGALPLDGEEEADQAEGITHRAGAEGGTETARHGVGEVKAGAALVRTGYVLPCASASCSVCLGMLQSSQWHSKTYSKN